MSEKLNIELPFEYKGESYDIPVILDWYVDNDGIGSYEFQGMKGYNNGNDYIIVEDFEFRESDLEYYEVTEEVCKAFDESFDDNLDLYAESVECVLEHQNQN